MERSEAARQGLGARGTRALVALRRTACVAQLALGAYFLAGEAIVAAGNAHLDTPAEPSDRFYYTLNQVSPVSVLLDSAISCMLFKYRDTQSLWRNFLCLAIATSSMAGTYFSLRLLTILYSGFCRLANCVGLFILYKTGRKACEEETSQHKKCRLEKAMLYLSEFSFFYTLGALAFNVLLDISSSQNIFDVESIRWTPIDQAFLFGDIPSLLAFGFIIGFCPDVEQPLTFLFTALMSSLVYLFFKREFTALLISKIVLPLGMTGSLFQMKRAQKLHIMDRGE